MPATPRPWTPEPERSDRNTVTIRGPRDSYGVAEVVAHVNGSDPEANAALICDAVNASPRAIASGE